MSSWRDEFTSVCEPRMRFLCLLHGGGETEDSVPAGRQKQFQAHVDYNVAYASRWYENACRYYGSTSGEFEDIPKDRQVEAINWLRESVARHESKCQFELELERVARREAAEADFG